VSDVLDCFDRTQRFVGRPPVADSRINPHPDNSSIFSDMAALSAIGRSLPSNHSEPTFLILLSVFWMYETLERQVKKLIRRVAGNLLHSVIRNDESMRLNVTLRQAYGGEIKN